MRQMAHDLPRLRRRLAADFGKRGFPKARVLAGVVKLLQEGFFRVGNEQYARENHTFGITTLRKSHVRVIDDTVVFSFVGKRSIKHKRSVVSAELARFVTAMLTTPGPRLFRYVAPDGTWSTVDARQVNEYIQSIAKFPYSAKDFRTWGGSLRAATVLAELGAAASEREARKNVATAMRLVAAELGNTPTICRKSYVHPVLVEQYLASGAVIRWRSTQRRAVGAYAPEERALIAFLDEHFPERRTRRRTEA
jgi:DNA topoisomerase-1